MNIIQFRGKLVTNYEIGCLKNKMKTIFYYLFSMLFFNKGLFPNFFF